MKNRFHTGTAVRTGIRIIASLIFGAAVLSHTSCVKEDTSDCPVQSLLYIVVDSEGWPGAENVGNATVFVYDGSHRLISSIEVSGTDIEAGKPVAISYKKGDAPWIAVWGNLGAGETVPAYDSGISANDMFVSMTRGGDGYAIGPDALYYGSTQLAGAQTEYVTITPKTGRLYIMVKGLPPTTVPDAYYFTAATPYGSYNFTGTPVYDDAELRFTAVFDGTDLVTSQAFHLFHFPEPYATGNSLTIGLYDNTSSSPVMMAAADTDINGNPIVIERGKDTYVEITLQAGNIEVHVAVLDWYGNIDQHGEW